MTDNIQERIRDFISNSLRLNGLRLKELRLTPAEYAELCRSVEDDISYSVSGPCVESFMGLPVVIDSFSEGISK